MTDAGIRPQRPRRPIPPLKPKAPPWVIVVFIGVPSVLIVIMLGIIIKQQLFDGAAEPPPPPPPQQFDPAVMKKDADLLYVQALRLKAQATEKQRAEKDSSVEFKSGIEKLKQAQQKYSEILERIRSEHQGKIPDDYRGYERETTKIQQALIDMVKMKTFK